MASSRNPRVLGAPQRPTQGRCGGQRSEGSGVERSCPRLGLELLNPPRFHPCNPWQKPLTLSCLRSHTVHSNQPKVRLVTSRRQPACYIHGGGSPESLPPLLGRRISYAPPPLPRTLSLSPCAFIAL